MDLEQMSRELQEKDVTAKPSNDMLDNMKDASIVQESISKHYLLVLFSSGFLVALLQRF